MRKILMACLLITVLSACTHNNGDIGNLFGQWRLEKVQVNGSALEGYDGQVYWSFQNNVIWVKTMTGEQTERSCYGTWREEDNTMFLEFPDDEMDFIPLQQIHLQRSAQLLIVQGTRSSMELQYSPDNETSIIYTFKKW